MGLLVQYLLKIVVYFMLCQGVEMWKQASLVAQACSY